jgi:folate-binding protein YgfZ
MGFDVYAPNQDEARIFAALSAAGAVRITEETAEALRIEAGRPKFAVDMDTDTIPLEAGIEDRAISMTKGCYVGQEVIVRVLHRGHGRVARKLAWLEIEGRGIPSSGDLILAEEREVGRITSVAFSPRANALLALGYVQRDFVASGTAVTVKSGGRMLHAKVRQLGK